MKQYLPRRGELQEAIFKSTCWTNALLIGLATILLYPQAGSRTSGSERGHKASVDPNVWIVKDRLDLNYDETVWRKDFTGSAVIHADGPAESEAPNQTTPASPSASLSALVLV